MAFDLEGSVLEPFLRKTLWLWLFPYIVWFFGRRIVLFLYEWLTKPATTEEPPTASRA
ncbi:MAG: hypothetical protein Q8R32_00690 [bacterium]|nr:hypothetical protein [bacterium]